MMTIVTSPKNGYNVIAVGSTNTNGTSYASPVVTGTVALMMEKRPNLIIYPELVMPLLTANADNMADYTGRNSDGFNDQVGAGFINIDATLANIDKSVNFAYLTQNQSGVFVSETSVTLSAN